MFVRVHSVIALLVCGKWKRKELMSHHVLRMHTICPVTEVAHAGFSWSDEKRCGNVRLMLERWGENAPDLLAVTAGGHESWASLGWGYDGTFPPCPVAKWKGVKLSDPGSRLGISKLDLPRQSLKGTSHSTHTYIHTTSLPDLYGNMEYAIWRQYAGQVRVCKLT